MQMKIIKNIGTFATIGAFVAGLLLGNFTTDSIWWNAAMIGFYLYIIGSNTAEAPKKAKKAT
jgi:hypothetical protein